MPARRRILIAKRAPNCACFCTHTKENAKERLIVELGWDTGGCVASFLCLVPGRFDENIAYSLWNIIRELMEELNEHSP